jgi:hypothetical protein
MSSAIHLAQPGVDGSACGLRQSGRTSVIHRVREIGAVTCRRCLQNARDLHRRPAPVRDHGASETEIQADVIAYLEHDYRVGVVWRMSVGGRGRHTFGVRGQADVFAILRGSGRFVGLEVKTARESAKPHQEAWGATVTAAGGVYAVVRSAEDARAVIDRACERTD